MLLSPAALPDGFHLVGLTVSELTSANAQQLAATASTSVEPEACRPTADEKFNRGMSSENTAVLGATSASAALTTLTSTRTRDVDADLAASTGPCATTRTAVTAGTMRGAVITTEHTRLDPPELSSSTAGFRGRVGQFRVRAILLLRNRVTTRIADGSSSVAIGYAAYATGLFTSDAATAAPATVQLVVSGNPSTFDSSAPTPPSPMSDDGFVSLFGKALAGVGDTGR